MLLRDRVDGGDFRGALRLPGVASGDVGTVNEQQRSMSAASREAKRREERRNGAYTSGPEEMVIPKAPEGVGSGVVSSPALSERAQPFRIPENATIETALSLSFAALGLDNWAEVKRELARHLRATTMQIASETRTW